MAQLIYVEVVVVVARDLDAFEELLFIGFRVWGTTRFCCTCTCSAVFMEFRLDWIWVWLPTRELYCLCTSGMTSYIQLILLFSNTKAMA